MFSWGSNRFAAAWVKEEATYLCLTIALCYWSWWCVRSKVRREVLKLYELKGRSSSRSRSSSRGEPPVLYIYKYINIYMTELKSAPASYSHSQMMVSLFPLLLPLVEFSPLLKPMWHAVVRILCMYYIVWRYLDACSHSSGSPPFSQ